MYKKLLACTLIAASLAARSDKKEEPKVDLACQDPAIIQSIRNNIQDVIKQDTRQFANSDSRQFVDADKVIAAGSELQINLDNAKQDSENGTPFCTADLSINIPAEVMTIAQSNSPLLYGEQSVSQLIQQQLTGSQIQYNGVNSFNKALRYTPSKNTDNQTIVTYADNSVSTLAQTLSAALRSYGVKSILVINGKAVNRDDALRQLTTAEISPPEADPEDILNNGASNEFASNLPAAEVLTPPTNNPNEVTFSATELEQARAQQREADSEINRLWQRMDQTVQRELINEQREWINSKNNSCRQAAARAETTLQAEYLQSQCDARMTRERAQYLRGYAIP